MRSMINDMLCAHFVQTSQDTQVKLDVVASSLVHQLVLATKYLQCDLMQSHTSGMQQLCAELAQSREENRRSLQQAQAGST